MKKAKGDPFKIKIRSSSKRTHKKSGLNRDQKGSKNVTRVTSTSRRQKETIARAIRLLETIAQIKENYRELDEIIDELLKQGFTEGFLNGKHLIMKDKFAVKNTVWKSTPQRRYELELA